jgi:AcrR family transcriptional regulator
MDKRERIVDALESLMREGVGGRASVSDIARRAGIAKGGLYYYFPSKEAVLDALVERHFAGRIATCREAAMQSGLEATARLALLLRTYRAAVLAPDLDASLHQPDNAAIHQRSLAMIVTGLSPMVAGILRQGMEEGTFASAYPAEVAEITVCVIAFLFDSALFALDAQQALRRMKALATLLEAGLHAPAGSFGFLWGAQGDAP